MTCLFENGCVFFYCHLPAQSQSNDSYSHNKESCLSVGTKRDQDCQGVIIKNMNEQNYLIVSDNIGIIKYINIKI